MEDSSIICTGCVVDILEQKYPDFPGLNLSWEVKESIVKHISPYDHTSTTTEYNIDEMPLLEAQIVTRRIPLPTIITT